MHEARYVARTGCFSLAAKAWGKAGTARLTERQASAAANPTAAAAKLTQIQLARRKRDLFLLAGPTEANTGKFRPPDIG